MHTFAQKPQATRQTTPARLAIPVRGHSWQRREVGSILHLQRTAEGRAVQRLSRLGTEEAEADSAGPASPRFGHDFSRIPIHPPAAGTLQAKLAANEPGDSCERDADRIAEQVMRTPEPRLDPPGGGRPTGHAEQPATVHGRLQTKRVEPSDTGTTAAPPAVHEALRSPGQPLDPATRAFMEPRFGHDFSRVRVHTGAAAEESARDLSAHAYTVGHDVVFGAGRFAPEARAGRRLIAHELTHVVQQSGVAGSRAGDGDGGRGLPGLGPAAQLRVQRAPSDGEPPGAGGPIFGGSPTTTDTVVLYHYGDLESRREMDARTDAGAPFRSPPGYPRLTDCDTATCQVEVTRYTGTPQNDKLRYKYELRIDRAYFEKNFTNTGTRGAYSEFVSKQSIPIRYFRIVSEIAPSSSAQPRVPATSGGFTAKPPRPSPPTQRGKAVTQGGSYQEVLSGETVTGQTGARGAPPAPSGGAPAGPAATGGTAGGAGTPATPSPAGTAPVRAETGSPLAPVVEATPGFRPEVGAGLRGAAQMLQARMVGNLQQAEVARYEKRLAQLQPHIDGFLGSGYAVELVLIVEKPNSYDFLCASGVFCDQGQVTYFHDLFIDRVESVQPVTSPSPRAATSQPTLSAPGGRDGFIPYTHQGGSLIDLNMIPSLTPRDPVHHCVYERLTLKPKEPIAPIEPRRTPAQPVKPRPRLDPETRKALALAPSRIYIISGNIVQYRKVVEIQKKLAGNASFVVAKEELGGGLNRSRTLVSYLSDLDRPRAEALAAIIRGEGVASVYVELSGDGGDAPGVLQVFFGRDAER
jgi:hypothetical protein